jgi:hypothetical protein
LPAIAKPQAKPAKAAKPSKQEIERRLRAFDLEAERAYMSMIGQISLVLNEPSDRGVTQSGPSSPLPRPGE